MMKKIVAVFVMSLLSSSLAYGVDNKLLEAYAKAPRVGGLTVKVDSDADNNNKSTLIYALTDTITNQVTEIKNVKNSAVLSDKSFRYDFNDSNKFYVNLQEFSPLKYAIKIEYKDEKTEINDPSLFFEALSGYKSIFVGKSGGEPVLKSQGLMSALPVPARAPTEPKCADLFDKYDSLANAINNTIEENGAKKQDLESISVTDIKIKKWKADTINAKGVSDTIDDVEKLYKKLDANIIAIKKAVAAVEKVEDKDRCTSIPVYVIAQISYIMSKAQESIVRRETSSTSLKALSKYLEKYKDPKVWDGNYYLIGPVAAPAKNNLKKVTITVKEMDFSPSEDKITIKEIDTKTITSSFTIYKNENISFIPSAGFVYSPLKSVKFSTKSVNGNQVVEKTEESDNYHAALFLNVYYTEWIKENVYPFFQLGVSSAKEYPALLTGLGIRIRDTSFAVSGGAAFGFTKELNKLSEGATVTGQADIDKDEKITVKPTWYLSLQYSF